MDLILGGVDVKAEKEKERLEALAKAAPVELICISISLLYFWTILANVVFIAKGVGELIEDIL